MMTTGTPGAGEVPTARRSMTEFAAWLPAVGAVLFILGWLGIEAFFRRFGLTAAEAGFGTTEAIALAGVQLAVLTVAGVVGYLACRWVLVYLPPKSPELFARLRIEWVGIIFWALFVLPLLVLLPGGSPFGRHSNAPLILIITVGVMAGALFDHWQRTDRGTTSPLQLRNIGLMGLWAVIGLIVSLAPLLGAEALKRGETAYRRSLLVVPAVAQVTVLAESPQCALLLGTSDETYLLWDFRTRRASRTAVSRVELRYERCWRP